MHRARKALHPMGNRFLNANLPLYRSLAPGNASLDAKPSQRHADRSIYDLQIVPILPRLNQRVDR